MRVKVRPGMFEWFMWLVAILGGLGLAYWDWSNSTATAPAADAPEESSEELQWISPEDYLGAESGVRSPVEP